MTHSPPPPATLDAASALASLPVGLRTELLKAFNEVLRNYRERRWEPSELNGGKLSEVVYSILRGHIDGTFPSKPAKPPNMVDACRALENADPSKFPRAVRIQLPRVLIALYEIRNNRGVGHVGGDVDPNLMDATAVVALSKWAVAELIRVFHSVQTDEAQELVEALVERTLPVIWKVGDIVRVLNPKMSAKEKVLVLLYHVRSWVDEGALRSWVEYASSSKFRDVLKQSHKEKLIEYDATKRRATLSPKGMAFVEQNISLTL